MVYGKKSKSRSNIEKETQKKHHGPLKKLTVERNAIRDELEREQNIMHQFLHFLPDAFYLKDKQGHFLRVNKAQAGRYGCDDPADIIGKTDYDFINEKDARGARDADLKVLTTGKVSLSQRKKTLPDGQLSWISTTKVPLTDSEGNIIGVFGLTHDITRQKIAEQALQKSKDRLRQAKQETDMIMKNVREGLFILEPNFCISSQYSNILEELLGENKLSHQNLVRLLEHKLNGKETGFVADYLSYMFDPEIDEETINRLNPLSEVELDTKQDSSGRERSIFLSFQFNRIYQRNKIKGLMVTVTDISKQIKLSRRLEESQRQSKYHMDWLISLLNIEPQTLSEFMTQLKVEISDIDKILKSGHQEGDMQDTLNRIYRSVFSIKANASLLDISYFTQKIDSFEKKIKSLKSKSNLNGQDFIKLVLMLGDLQKTLTEIDQLSARISDIKENFRPKRAFDNKVLIDTIGKLIKTLSSETGTQISFAHKNFNAREIPGRYFPLVKDVLIHLIRNSLVHDGESRNDKSIEIATRNMSDHFLVKYLDAGMISGVEAVSNRVAEYGGKINKTGKPGEMQQITIELPV